MGAFIEEVMVREVRLRGELREVTWATMHHMKTKDFRHRTNKIGNFFFLKKNIFQSLLIVLEGPNKDRDDVHDIHLRFQRK